MNNLDELLKSIKIEEIKSDNEGYENLPDGYYLCEVEKVEFKESKSSGNEMIAWQFRVVENGISFDEELKKEYIQNTINRKIFTYHVLKDENSIKKAISDLLKFEESEDVPLLSRDYFINKEAMNLCFQLLIGRNIYIKLETDKDNSQWKRFVSWKGAKKLELVE